MSTSNGPPAPSPAFAPLSGGPPLSSTPAFAPLPGGPPLSSTPAFDPLPGGPPLSSTPAFAPLPWGPPLSSTPAGAPVSGGPLPSSASSGGGGLATTTIVGIAVGGVVALIIVAIVAVYSLKKKKPGDSICFGWWEFKIESHDTENLSSVLDPACRAESGSGKSVHKHPESSRAFTYEELKESTNGFSESNLLGEGGFGRVYKGTIEGKLVAVKQLKLGSGQGEREFRAEVDIISRVHHRHLVSLVGYCISETHRLLVYNYVPNGTLEEALHGRGKPVMDWATRLTIALGTARGLAYLHQDCHPRIIHRDIKGSNILLDNQWEAQVADFGLAKLADDSQSHVTTRVMGTFGYVAPEYAMSGKLTDKSDVYAFGVVLLQLITGKKPVDKTLVAADGEESLVEWARPLLTQAVETGNVVAIADPNLMGNYNREEMFRMVELAASCVRHSSQKRPKMVEAVRILVAQEADLHQGVVPGYSEKLTAGEVSASHMRIFRQMVYSSSTTEGDSKSEDWVRSASSNEFGSLSRREQPAGGPLPGFDAIV